MAYRLHALDITSGAEPYGPGVLISGNYNGATFDARYQTQRVSLALAGNQVLFGFGAVEAEGPDAYVGWVMAYNKLTLQQSGAIGTVTTGNLGGGVWQSGRPLRSTDPVTCTCSSATQYGGGYDGVNDFSESVLKLDPRNGLQLIDWFTPSNWSYLDSNDLDMTSSGPLLIPGTNIVAGAASPGSSICSIPATSGNTAPTTARSFRSS